MPRPYDTTANPPTIEPRPNLAAALELDTVLRLLADHALAERVKARCLALAPVQTLSEAERRLEETTQARRIIEHTGTPPLAAMPELQKTLDLAAIGALLTPEQLTQVSVFLTTCRRLKGYLQKAMLTGADIAGYGGSIVDLADLEEEIERCIRNGQVDDRASPRLYDLRRGITAKGEQIRAKLDGLLRKNRAWFSESFVSTRNGRYTLPVKREYRASVPGSLIEMSGSGGTCFIEPASVQKLSDELAELRVEEDGEVRRVLYSLTATVAERLPEINLNIEAMETLDFLFAKAKLSLALGASPVRFTQQRMIHILAARHPLLDPATAVPLNFYLHAAGEDDGSAAGIVITGPNTGGKTVALKTVGLLSLMAQSGLHVPADPRSIFALHDGVYCDIGDGQSITENLSTFSSHLLSIMRILRAAGPRSLVLLDELGSGTDPAEGMGIAVAVLDELRALGCLFVATTHYPEIKDYALRTPGLVNARMAFDRESLRPLYRLEIGVAGESCALYIAERLGMPGHMLARARQAAGAEAAKSGALSPGEPALPPAPPEPPATAFPMPPPLSVAAEPPPAPPAPASLRFRVGDSVTLPGGEIGIVAAEANARGEVGVQVHGKKILVNHTRLKLKVAAAELYPDDYDLSIVLDSVANRKARHKMGKRHEAGNVVVVREGRE